MSEDRRVFMVKIYGKVINFCGVTPIVRMVYMSGGIERGSKIMFYHKLVRYF